MEEFKVIIEIEEELLPEEDRFGLEDKISDALIELGFSPIKVKIVW
ncbi:hypothetical protein LCGC14_0922580 [marine sediment metagenome]|uniref:Uncharacterized protein n=1 Tax=marine sediment metagenome TaxID=412755 RepID=A0A0F9RWW8_9ZZZZ